MSHHAAILLELLADACAIVLVTGLAVVSHLATSGRERL